MTAYKTQVNMLNKINVKLKSAIRLFFTIALKWMECPSFFLIIKLSPNPFSTM